MCTGPPLRQTRPSSWHPTTRRRLPTATPPAGCSPLPHLPPSQGRHLVRIVHGAVRKPPAGSGGGLGAAVGGARGGLGGVQAAEGERALEIMRGRPQGPAPLLRSALIAPDATRVYSFPFAPRGV